MPNSDEEENSNSNGLEYLKRIIDAISSLESHNKQEEQEEKSVLDDDNDLGLPVIHIETDMFDAWAVAFFAMPGMRIIEIMTVPEEKRTVMLLDLFKLALQQPEKAATLEILTFRELQDLLGMWMVLSNQLEQKRAGIAGYLESFEEFNNGE